MTELKGRAKFIPSDFHTRTYYAKITRLSEGVKTVYV